VDFWSVVGAILVGMGLYTLVGLVVGLLIGLVASIFD